MDFAFYKKELKTGALCMFLGLFFAMFSTVSTQSLICHKCSRTGTVANFCNLKRYFENDTCTDPQRSHCLEYIGEHMTLGKFLFRNCTHFTSCKDVTEYMIKSKSMNYTIDCNLCKESYCNSHKLSGASSLLQDTSTLITTLFAAIMYFI